MKSLLRSLSELQESHQRNLKEVSKTCPRKQLKVSGEVSPLAGCLLYISIQNPHKKMDVVHALAFSAFGRQSGRDPELLGQSVLPYGGALGSLRDSIS